MQSPRIEPPYAIFLGDEKDEKYAKTGFGLIDWRRALCVGQLRLTESAVDIGLPELSVAEVIANARTLVIGIAAPGGDIPSHWTEVLIKIASAGVNIASGGHTKLASIPALAEAARHSKCLLIDVRIPPDDIPIGTGRPRQGKRILTVGTDCAVGKKYTALTLEREMTKLGFNAEFRATGQTGIMIAGDGIPIDSVVCDFTAGAAEIISPCNTNDHWDIIEGQGSLFHPSYAGVSLGLLHGSQPDFIVLCHDASRTEVAGAPEFPLPGVTETIELNLRLGSRTSPRIQCIGISLNTSGISKSDRKSVLNRYSEHTGLPCVDPMIDGVDSIIRRLIRETQ